MLRASMAYIHLAVEVSALARQFLELLIIFIAEYLVLKGTLRGLQGRRIFFIISEPVKNCFDRFRGHICGSSQIRHVFLNQ
jgi:hypothetical protein